MIDAAQGVEAQTVANYHLAAKQNLTIIPVINKIDPVTRTSRRHCSSWKTCWPMPRNGRSRAAPSNIGIEDILEAIVAAFRRRSRRAKRVWVKRWRLILISTPTKES